MTPDELAARMTAQDGSSANLARDIQHQAEEIARLSVIDVEQAQQLVLLHGPRVAMQQAL